MCIHLPILLALTAPAFAQTNPLSDIRPRTESWQDIRVQVVPRTYTTIGAPMSGRLTEFPLRDGDSFQKGQVIARFACAEQESALAHARAVLQEKRDVLSTSSKLNRLGTSSGLEYRVAVAQVEEANADVQTATAITDNCSVKAPFAGRVASVAVRPFQSVGVGAPLLDILDDRTLELELILPSRWLEWLKVGGSFAVAIDETGKTYPAELAQFSGRVDPVSQSIKAYARLTGPTADLLAGMSGKALLQPPAVTQ